MDARRDREFWIQRQIVCLMLERIEAMRITLLLTTAFLSAAVAAARAGDAADLEILGFSADGGIFAFEQYGEQDGSGFPYADRFYIDTAKDAYVPGSPVRVRIESEDASVGEARQAARAKGESIVADAVLAQNRGYTAAMNDYTRRELKYENDLPYEILTGRVQPWSYANAENESAPGIDDR